MPSDFLPRGEGPLFDWLSNFATSVESDAGALGISDDQKNEFLAFYNRWVAARQAKIGAKSAYEGAVASQASAEREVVADVRELVAFLQKSAATTDETRRELRITVLKSGRSPVDAPATFPLLSVSVKGPMQHDLKFVDSATSHRKAKPTGVQGCEVRRQIVESGEAPPTNPGEMPFLALATRTPFTVTHTAGSAGKTAFYAARWTNPKGETGSWGKIVSLTIAG